MSDNEEKSNSRFSKAILTRILAVGLFVTVGTVAVVYLMSHGRQQEEETTADQDFEGAQLAVAEQPLEGFATNTIPAKAELKTNFPSDADEPNRGSASPAGRSTPPPTFSDSSFNPATDRFAAVPPLDRPNPPADFSQGSFAPANSPVNSPDPNRSPAAPAALGNPEDPNQKPSGFLPDLPNQPGVSGFPAGSAAGDNRSPDFSSDNPSASSRSVEPRSVEPVSKPSEGNPLAEMAKQSLNEIQAAFGGANPTPPNPAASSSRPLPPPDLPNRINTAPTASEPRLQGPTPQKSFNAGEINPTDTKPDAGAPPAFAPQSAPPPRTASNEPNLAGFNPATGSEGSSSNSGQSRSAPVANDPPSSVPNTPDPRSNPISQPSVSQPSVSQPFASQPFASQPSVSQPLSSGTIPETGIASSAPSPSARNELPNQPSGFPPSNSGMVNSFGTTGNQADSRTPSAAERQEPFGNATAAPRSSVLESTADPASPPNFQSNLASAGSAAPLAAGPGNRSPDPARMASNQPLARTANVPGERKLEGMQAPSLTVEKLSPREITVNEASKFMIVIRNVGRVDAMDVQVHDQVPANTEFVGSNPPVASQADRKIVWELGSIPVGKEARVEYQLKPLAPGEIGSVAQVTFATQASMRTMVTQPELEMVLRTKPVVMIGGDVVIEAMITNRGNGPAKQVLVQKDVPPQLEFQEGYRELEYEVGTLLPGQSKRIQLVLKAAKVGRFKNSMVATAVGGQRVQQEFDLEIVAPEIKLAADGPTRRFLNRQLTNTFSLSNQGTAAATNVELVARLPRGLKFVSANNQGIYRPQNHSVVWSMAQLPTNVDAQVELVTIPVEIGEQDIQFQVAADLNIRNSISHVIQVEHSVDIYFDIRDMVDPIEVGAETAYQVRLVNQGTIVATNVRLQAQFPAGLVPLSVEGNLPNQIVGQTVQFSPVASLRPGEEFQLRIRAKGAGPGDHRVILTMQADGRETAVTKEEATRVYADR